MALITLVLAFAYLRAWPWGLWGLRLVLPVAGVWASFSSPWPGAVAIALWVAGLVTLAWSRPAARAISDATPPLPAPRPRRRPSRPSDGQGGAP